MSKTKFWIGVILTAGLSFCLSGLPSSGQQRWPRTVSGTILDNKTGDPLIGVYVLLEGTQTGAVSDLDGRFSLSVPENATLVFSYMGYDTMTLSAVDAVQQKQFPMNASNTELEEVVFVGYGQQKKATSVGAVTQTGGDDLMKGGSVNSVSEALQGKLNGVVSISTSGAPGDNEVTLYIRGKSTWANTSPLVLLDGIESNINDVDMNEIESISVLKDASATAVYGVRGGNGVILITTKKGRNEAPKVNFSANYMVKAPTVNFSLADHITAIQAYNQAVANDGNWTRVFPQTTMTAWENAYATGNIGAYNDVFPYVNWRQELIGSGLTQNYNVNLRGGNDHMRYFVSLGYQDDGDVYKLQKQENYDPRHYYRRFNWRSNLDFDLTKSTTLSVRVAGNMGYRNRTTVGIGGGLGRLYDSPTSNFPVRYSDGEWGDDTYINPVCTLNMMGSEQQKTFQGTYEASLRQKLDFIAKGLAVSGKISYTSTSANSSNNYRNSANNEAYRTFVRYHRDYDYANPVQHPDGSVTYNQLTNLRLPFDSTIDKPVFGTSYDQLDRYSRNLYYEFSLNYDRSFGHHTIGALALVNRQVYDDKSGNNMRFPSYREDWVGRLTYNWKERYLSEFNISYTGSEKFARGMRFGLFPSFSLGWRFSEEPWIKNALKHVLTNGKVRYSWGLVGSDMGASRWNYVQAFTSGGSITIGADYRGHSWGPLYSEGDLANIHSTWEKSAKQNLGIEMNFIHKLTLNVDLFSENRHDILMKPQTTSPIVGASFNELNMGVTKNHGIELELRWEDKIGRDFSYYAKFASSLSENRIVFYDDPVMTPDHLKSEGKPIGHSLRYLAVGNYGSLDDVFNYAQSNSVNNTPANQVIPGDLVYVDFNADGVLNAQDRVAVDQLNYPLNIFSFTAGFHYKGWGFSALLYAPTGVWKLVNSSFFNNFNGGYVNAQPDVFEGRWTWENPNSSGIVKPSLHLLDASGFNGTESTFRYRNFSYLRLKNVDITYQIPKRLLSRIKVDSMQLYVTGTNLLTFWKGDRRIDPEGNQTGYPILRTVTGGLRLSL